jgi:hypothetical protein
MPPRRRLPGARHSGGQLVGVLDGLDAVRFPEAQMGWAASRGARRWRGGGDE